MINSEYQIHQSKFTEFEERSMMTRRTSFDFRKLDDTPFVRAFYGLHARDFCLTRSNYSCRLWLNGENPSGLPTFGVPMNPNCRLWWHGKLVEGNSSLLVVPSHGELQAVIDPNFDLFAISCSEELLLEKQEAMGLAGLGIRCNQLDVLACDPDKMRALRLLLTQITRYSNQRPLDLTEIKEQILTRLFGILGSRSSQPVSPVTSSKKRVAIEKTERYVLAHPDEAPRIGALCEIIGVSKRTLDYAFNENFGVSPKSYITALRLNGVHKILRTRTPSSLLVSDAANAWGFWHMGQFAADYRKLFGELPSETILSARCG